MAPTKPGPASGAPANKSAPASGAWAGGRASTPGMPAAAVSPPDPAPSPEMLEETIAYVAKRQRVSPAIVREIVRSSGLTERGGLEREVQRGKSRR